MHHIDQPGLSNTSYQYRGTRVAQLPLHLSLYHHSNPPFTWSSAFPITPGLVLQPRHHSISLTARKSQHITLHPPADLTKSYIHVETRRNHNVPLLCTPLLLQTHDLRTRQILLFRRPSSDSMQETEHLAEYTNGRGMRGLCFVAQFGKWCYRCGGGANSRERKGEGREE